MGEEAGTGVEIVLNGARQRLPAGTTVAAVVARLGRGPAGVAVAVNDEVVPRSTWPSAVLTDRDRVEVLSPAQGG